MEHTNPIILSVKNNNAFQVMDFILFDQDNEGKAKLPLNVEVNGLNYKGKELYSYQDLIDLLSSLHSQGGPPIGDINFTCLSGSDVICFQVLRYQGNSEKEYFLPPVYNVGGGASKYKFNRSLNKRSRFTFDLPAYGAVQIAFIYQ